MLEEILQKTGCHRRYTAAVVVLGDIGRSPRMCYHAYSLATQLDYNVNIVGYLDSTPHPLIHNNIHIKYVALSPPPDRIARLPEALQLPLKFLWTFLMLSWALLFRYIEWIYRWEGAFGRRADAGLCVTRAMREDLQRAWGVHAAVFYDRAPSSAF
ncbi:hypothetical protein TELCIR_20647, partial [Teladorsagia circumcincta]